MDTIKIRRVAGNAGTCEMAFYGSNSAFSWKFHEQDYAAVLPVGTANMGTHGLPENGYVHDVYTITNADKQAYSHYFVRILMGATSLVTELKLAQIEFLGVPRVGNPSPADSVLKGCMGPLNPLGQSYTYPESSKGLGCVVGYRQRQIHSGFLDTNSDPIYTQANLEPPPIRDIPFIGLIYKSQRVREIPTPGMGEMMGLSRSFSDLKCAKIISTQKDGPAGGTAAAPVYNEDGKDYVTTVNVGAADAKFLYNETLGKITLNSLHTQMRIGQKDHNFNDNTAAPGDNTDGSIGLPGAPDLVQRLHFQTMVWIARPSTGSLGGPCPGP